MAQQLIVAPVPRLRNRWTYMGGTYLMASDKPKDELSAVDFMLYLTAGKHADAINSIQNAVPPRKSAGTSEYVKDPLIRPFYDAVQHGWSYSNHDYCTEIRDVIVVEVIAAMRQQKSVQATPDDAARGSLECLTRS